jgi:hypothetical protein
MAPETGDRLVILGAATTVKLMPLLATPDAVTTTFPVVAPAGTTATMLLALQLLTLAVVPLNLTLPFVDPKFAPAIVTEAPTAPEAGDTLVMLGAATTVKLFPLLATPDTVTSTFPVVAPAGTTATMLLALQLVTLAVTPLNLTVLVPWVDPKFAPVILTEAPTAPVTGDRLVILGAARASDGRHESSMHSSTNACRTVDPEARIAGRAAQFPCAFERLESACWWKR